MDVILGGFVFACLIGAQFLAVVAVHNANMRDGQVYDSRSSQKQRTDVVGLGPLPTPPTANG